MATLVGYMCTCSTQTHMATPEDCQNKQAVWLCDCNSNVQATAYRIPSADGMRWVCKYCDPNVIMNELIAHKVNLFLDKDEWGVDTVALIRDYFTIDVQMSDEEINYALTDWRLAHETQYINFAFRAMRIRHVVEYGYNSTPRIIEDAAKNWSYWDTFLIPYQKKEIKFDFTDVGRSFKTYCCTKYGEPLWYIVTMEV